MPRKLALIIGNNDYQINPLKNCVNDATSLAKILMSVKIEVELQVDLKSDDMYECIKRFAETIRQDDFVIFFFAGHGMQWGDQNFLLPCDNGKITSDRDMQRYATNAQQNIDEMANMKPHVILFLLDCCREYWLPSTTRSIASNSITNNHQIGGLNKMTAPPGTLIAFACAPGQTVADQWSETKNGIFTKYLLEHIIAPGMDIELVLRKVAADVSNDTNHKQIPYRVSSIMTENVCLIPIGKYITA
jgi:uncharacterized caspase-like protein